MTESGRLCAFITKVRKGSLADTVGHLRPGIQKHTHTTFIHIDIGRIECQHTLQQHNNVSPRKQTKKLKIVLVIHSISGAFAGDQVLEWNGKLLQGATFKEVYNIILESKPEPQVELVVSRPIG